ncbi:hypothetical protein DL765_003930 [Monosporascus sp. GIB2]|nr:hypothetical protein DL765_003930 [Monosporascus sp. GIB2]
MSGIRRDVRAREDRYQQVEDELLDTLQSKSYKSSRSHKSSRSTSVQPKASQSAPPPEVKASGSKEVPIALESDMEEINPLREGETKPRSSSSGGPPKKKKDRHSSHSSSGSSSSDSSSELSVSRKKGSKKFSNGDDSKLR